MPLFYVCLAFLAGIAVAGWCGLAAGVWLITAGACTGCALLFCRWGSGQKPVFGRWASLLVHLQLDPAAVSPVLIRILPFLIAASFALGAGRWSAVQPVQDEPDFIAYFNDDPVRYTVIGTLAAPPDVRDSYVQLRVEADEIRPSSGVRHLPVRGLLLARIDSSSDLRYGDRVAVTGRLQTPPEDEGFSYRDYLARQGVYAYMPFAEAARLEGWGGSPLLQGIYALKDRAYKALVAVFPDPEGALLAGILLGLDRGLSPDLQDAFRDTGTSHIIAISGFNISIIAAIAASAFNRLVGPRLGAVLAVLAIGGYTVLVGADAAVVRAAVMGGLAILLRQAGRPSAGLNSLVVTASIMAYFNPDILWDAGFQLSFSATLGLVLYAEPLASAFSSWAVRYWRISAVRRVLPLVSDAVLLTVAAQLSTLPVILYHFGRLSLSAFLVNPLILPVQPAVMVLGGLATAGGMLWEPAGQALAFVALPFVTFSIRLVEVFSRLPGGVFVSGKLGPGVALLLSLGPMLVRTLRERVGTAWPAARVVLAVLLLGSVVLVWRTVAASGMGLLRIWVLDVGMGEAVLIQTPGDRWVLVNGGPSGVKLSDQLGRRLPVHQRRLDWLVVGGTGDAQIGALPRVLERFYPAGGVLWAGMQNNTHNIRNMQEMMNKWALDVTPAAAGQTLQLGGGAQLEVLETTRRGAVLLLEWDDFRLLLPTGSDFDTLQLPLEPVTALLLADSGFGPLNPPEWIQRLQPDLVLLSVAAGNREALPDPALVDALTGTSFLRTDFHGWIELVTDGERLWVTTERQ